MGWFYGFRTGSGAGRAALPAGLAAGTGLCYPAGAGTGAGVGAFWPAAMLAQLAAAAALDFEAYFPVSGRTGDGVPELVDHLAARLPEGPALYPPDAVTDSDDAFWVAELVREQLLQVTRQELPHSIATRVTEWEWPRIRCEILVERPSQKPMVIGRGGSVLEKAGRAVRAQLPPGARLELFVKVDEGWPRRPDRLQRLGI